MADDAARRTRWSPDTERAFLLALRLTGNARAAAREIGRDLSGAYARRKADAGFAERWREALDAHQDDARRLRATLIDEGVADEIGETAGAGWHNDATIAAGGARLIEGQERPGGWDVMKRRRFLRALVQGGCAEAAAREAGMTKRAAYELRKRSPRFAAAWKRAMAADPPPSAHDAAYARGVEGWLEPIVYQGEVVAHRRRFSDAALRLAVGQDAERARLEETRAAREEVRYADPEDTDRAILAKLDQIEARRKKLAREDAIAFADRMVAEGKAP